MKQFFIFILIGFIIMPINLIYFDTVTGLEDPKVTITFDEPEVETTEFLSMFYSNQGIILPEAATIIPLPSDFRSSRAKSLPNVLVSRDLGDEFDGDPIIIQLTYPVQAVKLYTGDAIDESGLKVIFTLEAYDEGGQIVDQMIKEISDTPTDINLEMVVADPEEIDSIKTIKLNAADEFGNDLFEFIDDISLYSSEEPPISAEEPLEIIFTKLILDEHSTDVPYPFQSEKEDDLVTWPTSSKSGSAIIEGEIHGKDLTAAIPPPKVIVNFKVEPGSTTPATNEQNMVMGYGIGYGVYYNAGWVLVEGGDPYIIFSVPLQLNYFGKNVITVKAANAFGTSQKMIALNYFPQWTIDYYEENKLGEFIWGKTNDDCSYAHYQEGAIFNSPDGTYITYGNIYDKWSTLKASDYLGCAISEEKHPNMEIHLRMAHNVYDIIWGTEGFEIKLVKYQDFIGGRIYDSPHGTFYTIEPFISAIDSLCWDYLYGIPSKDPEYRDTDNLYLPLIWQKFEPIKTTESNDFTADTYAAWWIWNFHWKYVKDTERFSIMEITEDPLTLWTATYNVWYFEKPTAKRKLPTEWRSFECEESNGKITVKEPIQPQPINGNFYLRPNSKTPSLPNTLPYSELKKACVYGHYPYGEPQWARLNHNKITLLEGTIKKSGLPGSDAPWNHDCTPCSLTNWDCFQGVDWCVYVDPDPEYYHLMGGNQDAIEVEYEWCLVGYPQPEDYNKPNYDDPWKNMKWGLYPGHRIIVAGRWISDCGCHPFYSCSHPYRSEIHPPALLVDIFGDTFHGKPVTNATAIAFDWWYPNEVVEFDIFPPPRPTPTSIISYTIPIWEKEFCPADQGKCGFEVPFNNVKSNHIRIKFSGRPDVLYNTPPVEDYGFTIYSGKSGSIKYKIKAKGSGQLFHGSVAQPIMEFFFKMYPNDELLKEWNNFYEHSRSLNGDFIVGWRETSP